MIKNVIKVATVAAVVGLAAGCAHDNTAMQSQIDQAMQAAQSAQTTASAAQAAANQAQQTAQQALAAANQAKATAQANSKRIERAFRQSQQK